MQVKICLSNSFAWLDSAYVIYVFVWNLVV